MEPLQKGKDPPLTLLPYYSLTRTREEEPEITLLPYTRYRERKGEKGLPDIKDREKERKAYPIPLGFYPITEPEERGKRYPLTAYEALQR